MLFAIASSGIPWAWRIPGTGEPGGLPSMGSHRVGHDWSDLAVAAARILYLKGSLSESSYLPQPEIFPSIYYWLKAAIDFSSICAICGLLLLFSHWVMSYSLRSISLFCPCYSAGKNIRMDYYFLLQGLFQTQGLTSRFPELAGRFFILPDTREAPNYSLSTFE